MIVKTTLKAKTIREVTTTTTICIAVVFMLLVTIAVQSMNSATAAKQPTTIFAPTILAASGNNIYAVWSGNQSGNWEISFRASSDNGKTFGEKMNLSNDISDSTDPQIAAAGSNVYVTWWNTVDKNTGSKEPVMRISNDNGKTFGEKMMLSTK
jgi:hypothetical protein